MVFWQVPSVHLCFGEFDTHITVEYELRFFGLIFVG